LVERSNRSRPTKFKKLSWKTQLFYCLSALVLTFRPHHR